MADRIVGNQLAWKGETPWHGKGHRVEPGATGAEMLQAAGLDWKVQRRALAMKSQDGAQVLTEPLNGFRAIVRADTDEVFQVATERYHPVQNAEIVDYFREYCEAGHAEVETVGAIDGGRKVWALAKLNGGTQATLAGGDKLSGFMLLASSHDGSLRLIGKPTQVRVVCWNTLSAAIGEDSEAEFRMKHSRKFTPEVRAVAQKVMGMAIEQVQAVNEAAQDLSQVQIDDRGRVEYVTRLLKGQGLLEQVVENSRQAVELDAILEATENRGGEDKDLGRVGRAILEAIVSSPGAGLESAQGTLWGALNGVTYWVDHQRGRSQDGRLSGAWFGPGDQLKSAALRMAVEMAH